MDLILYLLVYPLIWLMSYLPMTILYFFSDVLYLIIYYVFGYRKKVVLNNLKIAFPDKEDQEIQKISKRFFRHLTDLIVESIKSFSISKKEVSKRYRYTNPELVNGLVAQGKSIALVGAHQANWEWSFSLPLVLNATVFGAYTKLGNKYFEKTVKTSRMKFGVIGYKTSETVKAMHDHYSKEIQGIYILLSDQSPVLRKTHHWRSFFNVKVPVHTGAEMLAKKFNLTVVNYVTRKIKRGYYETTFELLTEKPKAFENYKVTDKYIELTEKNIRKQPEYYLWSHKRFKHRDRYQEWLEKYKK